MTNIVEAKSLTKNYAIFTALDGVDMTIPRGAIQRSKAAVVLCK